MTQCHMHKLFIENFQDKAIKIYKGVLKILSQAILIIHSYYYICVHIIIIVVVLSVYFLFCVQ